MIAPPSCSLWFAHPPGAGNGCASIKIDNAGGLIVQLCHIVLHRAMRPDERISAGTSLGVIGVDGAVGNGGIAHLHLSMHRTPDYGVTRLSAPFSAHAGGLDLEGLNLPGDGSRNQYACPSASCRGTLVSSNGIATTSGVPTAMVPMSAPAAPPATVAAPGSTRPTTPAPSVPSSPAGAGPLRAGVRAIVAGAGDCVNIREAPSTSARIRQCLPDGARLRVVDGPVAADGYEWWRLDGLGWAAGRYLSPVAPSLEIGGSARVNVGEGECLNVRNVPTRNYPASVCLAHGTAIRLVAGPIESEGMLWWRIDDAGWVSGEYLTPEE